MKTTRKPQDAAATANAKLTDAGPVTPDVS